MQPLIILTFLGTQYNEVQSAIIVSAILGIIGLVLFLVGKLIKRTRVSGLRWLFFVPLIPIALIWIWFVGFKLFAEGFMAVMNYIIHDATLVLLTVGFLICAGLVPTALFTTGKSSRGAGATGVRKSGDKWVANGVVYDNEADARAAAGNQ